MHEQDKALAEACSQNNSIAQQQLYDKYRAFVLSLCGRFGSYETAEDIAQDCWMNIFRYIDKFQGISAIKSWIGRIAINTCRMNYRYMKNKPSGIDIVEAERLMAVDKRIFNRYKDSMTVNCQIVDKTIERESRLKLYKIIDDLPPVQRLVMLQRARGEELKDISKAMRVNIGTVKSNQHKAWKAIRRQYAQI